MIRRLTLVAGLIALTAAPLMGQVQVGLSAFVGGYLPLNNLFDSVRIGTENPVILNLGQKPGPILGGRLTVRLSRVAFEAEMGYVLSDLEIPGGANGGGDASVVLGSLNVLYDFLRTPFTPLSLFASGGVGLVSRRGEFFDEFDGTTSFAAVLGLGLRYGLSPTIFLRFDLKDYISSFQPTARSGFEFDSKTQNDLLATVAIEFSLSPTR
jgi:hypothetical protein